LSPRPKKPVEPTPLLEEIEKGHPLKVVGERGPFKFIKINEEDDSVTVWGGDKDPNGYNSMRTFTSDRIKVQPNPRS
jgi:hypothetical protein